MMRRFDLWVAGSVVVAVVLLAALTPHGRAVRAAPGRAGPVAAAGVPPLINYQGYLTDGSAPAQGVFAVTFRLFADSTGGTALWTESYAQVSALSGVFNVLLGSQQPLPLAVFDGSRLWIETEVDGVVLQPRRPLVSVPYSFHARTADIAQAANTRDTYHEIADLMPNTALRTFVIPRQAGSRVILYLHGEGFGGTVLAHTHDGQNAHDHSYSGASGNPSADHTHGFSATTGGHSADHVHGFSATSGGHSSDHSHSGSTSGADLTHSHGANTAMSGPHYHDLRVDGVQGAGNYLVHSGDVNGLSASDTGDRTLYQSVAGVSSILQGPNHAHALSSDLGVHTHSFGTGGASSNHSHGVSGTTGGASASHTHALSGTSGTASATHVHAFSGTTSSTGSGLGVAGVVPGTLPTSVYVYVDGGATPVAGPFSGQFSSGAIDLSSHITDEQEHTIEIREEGGTGGRIVYTFFVEYSVAGATVTSSGQGRPRAVDGEAHHGGRQKTAP